MSVTQTLFETNTPDHYDMIADDGRNVERFVLSEDTLTKAKFCSPFLLSQNIFEEIYISILDEIYVLIYTTKSVPIMCRENI